MSLESLLHQNCDEPQATPERALKDLTLNAHAHRHTDTHAQSLTRSHTAAAEMTGAAVRRETRAIRRACPQEAIRRASVKPDDENAAAAAAAAALEVAAKEAIGPMMQAFDEEDEEDEMPQPLRMERISRKEKKAVRRACPREGLRRASIRPDAMAHEAVILAAIQAGRSSAPPAMERGSATTEQHPQSSSRPSSADFSPRTVKAVRRVMPKKALSFRERQPNFTYEERKSGPEPDDLTDLANLMKEQSDMRTPGAAYSA